MSGPRASSDDAVLSVNSIDVWLSRRKVLDNVRFAIGPGEFTGLIGSNGAGKTTLMRVILGLQTASGGTVLVDGRPRARRNPLIGYVPQKVLLDPDLPLRGRDVVALGLDGHRLGMPTPSRRRRVLVDAMLEAVDALDLGDARVGNLSGGEQQRILIAHAMISRPKLLLLDEPLANLDIRSEQEVVELIARVARDQDVAVLISAHDMNPLLPVMDRVVYLANGRAAVGKTSEVVQTEVLSALYGHRVEVLRVQDRVLVVAGRASDPTLPPDRPGAHGGLAASRTRA